MKFWIAVSMPRENLHDTYKTFAQMTDADDETDRGGVHQIGRWHDVAGGKALVICESDDLAAVHAWAWNWNNVIDVEITPVLDDDEVRALVRKKLDL